MGSWEESKLRFSRVRELLVRAQEDARQSVAHADARVEELTRGDRSIGLTNERRQELRRERDRFAGSSRRAEEGLRACARSMLAVAEREMKT
jgi:hypothetical protein